VLSQHKEDEAGNWGDLKPGGKVMDWFNGKTSIAGIHIPNWLIVLGAAVIVILLITSMR
jgi:hypothetical protein